MEHWDHRVCRAWSELELGATLLLSACTLGIGAALAFGLGLA